MGTYKYLFYMAFRRDLNINIVSSKYTKLKKEVPVEEIKKEKSKSENQTEDKEEVNVEENKSNYILTLTQLDDKSSDDSMFEAASQVNPMTYRVIKP